VTESDRHRLEPADQELVAALAETDPARSLIADILSIVPVSHWSFARFKGNGPSDQLLRSEGTETRREEFDHLKRELVLQRKHTTKGPRMAATLGPLEQPYVSGITLVFADMHRQFGILSLMRDARLGPFTSVEIHALALALDSAADRLSGLSVTEAGAQSQPAQTSADDSVMHVLDRELNVVLTWSAENERNAAITSIHARLRDRLPPIIEDAVRELISTWTSDPATQVRGVARPVPFLAVRTQPLTGPTGLFVGVLLERPIGGSIFRKAADAFALSPRELQVLALLLEGTTLPDVAAAMSITSSTVQDHISSMLTKTNSSNRSQLIAKLLRP
jgi:DNA-binding CsgD family transcriptional regulator